MDGHLSLAERHRPLRLRDFVGQDEAVKFLSLQINQVLGRSVLLHGPSGCGKSAMAEVYAAGLLCTGSGERPCRSRSCPSCYSFESGAQPPNLRTLKHGNVSDIQFAEQISSDVLAESYGNGRLIVWIDQAQLLSIRAFEILHEEMSRPADRVTYIVCADSIEQLPQKTRQLFYPLAVKPPTKAQAGVYLARLCQASSIPLESDALELVADLAKTSYRELALSLEINANEGRLTASSIRHRDQASTARDYVDLVLARKEFPSQLRFLDDWEVEPAEKIAQIAGYLGDMFDQAFGSCVGEMESLRRRAQFAKVWQSHIALIEAEPRALATRMLQIWDPEPLAGINAVRRKASEFDELLVGTMFDIGKPEEVVANWQKARVRTQRYRQVDKVKSADIPRTHQDEAAKSLTLDEARKLWDGASFMVQAYGVLLNAHITIRHARLDRLKGGKHADLLTEFLRELRMFVNRSRLERSQTLHFLYAHRNDAQEGLVTELVSHLPPCSKSVEEWIKDRFFKHRASSSEDAVQVRLFAEKDAFARHLKLVRYICAGLAPLNTENKKFRYRTGIDSARLAWTAGLKATSQRIGLSRAIDERAQSEASRDLKVLSIFDSQEADACSGWELKEYAYRTELIRHRQRLEEAAQANANPKLSMAALKREWSDTKVLREVRRPGFS